ncbi:hypothetical protein N7517_007499 [Penicillium concentricum]|uniref:Uncharacterized protein n=1 Tax=Penicillium concentricum TaxID=293559 RepID=A0A9W9SG24_9EURO|nr:uncharacterized protein N7517_007499 [Penicillium concentricum]KAJ5375493.1 hypothetical protein N7517_007499 [Penicillium concentricum]
MFATLDAEWQDPELRSLFARHWGMFTSAMNPIPSLIEQPIHDYARSDLQLRPKEQYNTDEHIGRGTKEMLKR